jgi:hypothetical protein
MMENYHQDLCKTSSSGGVQGVRRQLIPGSASVLAGFLKAPAFGRMMPARTPALPGTGNDTSQF